MQGGGGAGTGREWVKGLGDILVENRRGNLGRGRRYGLRFDLLFAHYGFDRELGNVAFRFGNKVCLMNLRFVCFRGQWGHGGLLLDRGRGREWNVVPFRKRGEWELRRESYWGSIGKHR